MVEFLKTIGNDDFAFEIGKRYPHMDGFCEEHLKGKVLVRQPNSPKKNNWWCEFKETDEGTMFRVVDNTEMTLYEMIQENKLLEL